MDVVRVRGPAPDPPTAGQPHRRRRNLHLEKRTGAAAIGARVRTKDAAVVVRMRSRGRPPRPRNLPLVATRHVAATLAAAAHMDVHGSVSFARAGRPRPGGFASVSRGGADLMASAAPAAGLPTLGILPAASRVTVIRSDRIGSFTRFLEPSRPSHPGTQHCLDSGQSRAAGSSGLGQELVRSRASGVTRSEAALAEASRQWRSGGPRLRRDVSRRSFAAARTQAEAR